MRFTSESTLSGFIRGQSPHPRAWLLGPIRRHAHNIRSVLERIERFQHIQLSSD